MEMTETKPAPFTIGCKVRTPGAIRTMTVTDWRYYPAWDQWLVRCEDGSYNPDEGAMNYALFKPHELERA